MEHYRLQWNIDKKEWDPLFNQIEKSNLLQSWNYGEVKKQVGGWLANRVFIIKNDEVIGLMQYLEKRFFFLGGIVRINRGPLWLKPQSNEEMTGIYHLISKQFGFRKRRILFLASDCPNTLADPSIFLNLGFRAR